VYYCDEQGLAKLLPAAAAQPCVFHVWHFCCWAVVREREAAEKLSAGYNWVAVSEELLLEATASLLSLLGGRHWGAITLHTVGRLLIGVAGLRVTCFGLTEQGHGMQGVLQCTFRAAQLRWHGLLPPSCRRMAALRGRREVRAI
jgi:hypothetical protein